MDHGFTGSIGHMPKTAFLRYCHTLDIWTLKNLSKGSDSKKRVWFGSQKRRLETWFGYIRGPFGSGIFANVTPQDLWTFQLERYSDTRFIIFLKRCNFAVIIHTIYTDWSQWWNMHAMETILLQIWYPNLNFVISDLSWMFSEPKLWHLIFMSVCDLAWTCNWCELVVSEHKVGDELV